MTLKTHFVLLTNILVEFLYSASQMAFLTLALVPFTNRHFEIPIQHDIFLYLEVTYLELL